MNSPDTITVLSSPKPRNSPALGIITILLGILCVSAPLFIGITIQYMVGASLVMGGIFQIILAIKSHQLPKFSFLAGLLTLACGAILFAKPLLGISILSFLLITYFISSGLIKIITALKLRPLSGWGWELTNGIISLLLGIALSKGWPVSGAWALGIFFGINLITTGIVMLLSRSISASANSTSSENDSTVIDV